MITVYLLIYVPILLFVVAFLYETWLSIVRLINPRRQTYGYLDATWEVTNTLLIFGVVMLLMLFTKYIDQIAAEIFMSTLLAGLFLLVRAACYLYIFYAAGPRKVGVIDYVFSVSHLLAALALVVTVLKSSLFLITNHPQANQQFVPYFIPGLIVVLAVTAIPIVRLYTTKSK